MRMIMKQILAGDNNNPIKIFPDCVRVSADERQIKMSAGEGWG